jgi:hypothetical protein
MYAILDSFRKSDIELGNLNLSFDEGTSHTIRGKWGREYGWLYDYDVRISFPWFLLVKMQLNEYQNQVQEVWWRAAAEEDVRFQQEVARL